MKGKTLADYFEVAKMFGVDNIDFYAAVAKAWLCDEDAAEDKTRQYWHIKKNRQSQWIAGFVFCLICPKPCVGVSNLPLKYTKRP